MSPRQNLRLSSLAVAVGLAVAAAGASAADAAPGASPAAMKPASVASADTAFAQKAAIGSMAEVELGKLAQQKAASDQVKQFGTHMVDDHSRAGAELKQIASAKGMTLPGELDAKHKAKLAKMQKLSGAQFDRAYMDDMVADHKEDVADFKKEANGGRDGDLKAFAAKTLPTLEDHLKMAQSTHAAVKGAKTASR